MSNNHEIGTVTWYLTEEKSKMDLTQIVVDVLLSAYNYGLYIPPLMINRNLTDLPSIAPFLEMQIGLSSVFDRPNTVALTELGYGYTEGYRSSYFSFYLVKNSAIIPRIVQDMYTNLVLYLPMEASKSLLYITVTDKAFCIEDNTDDTYIYNYTRWNSFVRRVNKKFLAFKGTAAEAELWDAYMPYPLNVEGFLELDGEVLFYEDVQDILPEEFRYNPESLSQFWKNDVLVL